MHEVSGSENTQSDNGDVVEVVGPGWTMGNHADLCVGRIIRVKHRTRQGTHGAHSVSVSSSALSVANAGGRLGEEA